MDMDIEKILRLKDQIGVLDNNILNDFFELDRMDILNQVFSRLHIPQSILDDEVIDTGLQNSLTHLEYSPISIQEAETYIFFSEIVEKRPGLSEYDAECIAIAKESLIYCTSNEKRVINTCLEYGVSCTGTIGILCCAFEYEILNKSDFSLLITKLFSDECSAHISRHLQAMIRDYYKL